MVLQNKYKARASRRYNSSRGGVGGGRGRGGRGRGSSRFDDDQSQFPSLHADDQGKGEGDDSHDDGDSQDDDGEGAAASSTSNSRYSRRKVESNAWRYQEKEVDPHEVEGSEPEPEVDLSGLLARVAKLDSSRTSKAISSEDAAQSSVSATQDEEDIDKSLLYLLDRQREREGRKGLEEEEVRSARPNLTSSELKLLEMEGRRLLEEKEKERRHYGRAQMLKSQQPKTISLNIGDGRRKDTDSQASRRAVKARPAFNSATLYDEDGEDFDQADGVDAVDDFLQQLSVSKEGQKPPPPAKASALEEPASVLPVPPSHSQRQDHEDFLDSII